MNIKKILLNHCLEEIHAKTQILNKNIQTIEESMFLENKSSAGDKHETTRAMLQIEREKAGKQLFEIEKQKEILKRISYDLTNQNVGLGSIVFTSKQNYFISISLGKFDIESKSFYAISLQTPIAKLLTGKQVGDKITFQGETFEILKLI